MAPAAKSPAKVQVAVGANPPVAAAAVGAEAAVGAQPKPAVPSWNELLLTSTQNDMSCEDYIDALKRDVDVRLQARLTQPPALGGIGLEGPLNAQEPLQITSKPKELGSFKEHWRWPTCTLALTNHGLYEAPGNIFWCSIERPTWDTKMLPATTLSYGQLATGRLFFFQQ